jgi:alkylation response protein AidB-like acyl-CoA dehydrogenase
MSTPQVVSGQADLSAEADEVRSEIAAVTRQLFDDKSPMSTVRALANDDLGFSEDVWAALAGLGFVGLEIDERYGGGGMSFAELAAVLREAGRRLTPLPLLSTAVLGAAALQTAGSPAQQAAWLPEIAAGRRRVTIGLGASLIRHDGATVSGRVSGVLDAAHVDGIVMELATSDGPALILVPASDPALTISPVPTYDQTRRLSDVRVDGLRLASTEPLQEADAAATIAWLTDRASTALAVDSAVGAESVLQLTVVYAKQREQFGRPIGSFQAIKHHCSNMLIAVQTARVAANAAVRELPSSPGASTKWASIAKSHAADAYAEVAGQGIFVHGGIGFTWEHDMHLYLKRAKLNQALFGTSAWHRERLARLVIDDEGGTRD